MVKFIAFLLNQQVLELPMARFYKIDNVDIIFDKKDLST
jgi:hypothetical protein